jgi:hypothetical protein
MLHVVRVVAGTVRPARHRGRRGIAVFRVVRRIRGLTAVVVAHVLLAGLRSGWVLVGPVLVGWVLVGLVLTM